MPCTWRQALLLAPPAARGLRLSFWGQFCTSPATAFRTRTSTHVGSRSAAVSRASCFLPHGEARSIRRHLAPQQARRPTSSTSFRSCARAKESLPLPRLAPLRPRSRHACSSCSPSHFSPHSARRGTEPETHEPAVSVSSPRAWSRPLERRWSAGSHVTGERRARRRRRRVPGRRATSRAGRE